MNKKDILKVLEESNKDLGKLTDKQHEQYTSDEFKNGVILGGLIVGNRPEIIEMFKEVQKTACILGGKVMGPIQGKKNVESGLISNLGKKMAKFNNRNRICPYCGISTRGIGYERWHGDKCKWKNNPKPIPNKKIPINEQIYKCQHCSKEIKGRNYFRWHGDKCKLKN